MIPKLGGFLQNETLDVNRNDDTKLLHLSSQCFFPVKDRSGYKFSELFLLSRDDGLKSSRGAFLGSIKKWLTLDCSILGSQT